MKMPRIALRALLILWAGVGLLSLSGFFLVIKPLFFGKFEDVLIPALLTLMLNMPAIAAPAVAIGYARMANDLRLVIYNRVAGALLGVGYLSVLFGIGFYGQNFTDAIGAGILIFWGFFFQYVSLVVLLRGPHWKRTLQKMV
ncbi:MAG TPA: hypothetical protein VJG85_01095 [Patescibacteria group bacterium]|nr:hypothetical protein [Patescibacteria group bacterium]